MNKTLVIAGVLSASASVLTVSAMNNFSHRKQVNSSETISFRSVEANANRTKQSSQKKAVSRISPKQMNSLITLNNKAKDLLKSELPNTLKMIECIKELGAKINSLCKQIIVARNEQFAAKLEFNYANQAERGRLSNSINEKEELITQLFEQKVKLENLHQKLSNLLNEMTTQKGRFSFLNTMKSKFVDLVSHVRKALKKAILFK